MYVRIGAALLFIFVAGAAARADDEKYPRPSASQSEETEDEQAACRPDAMKFCEDEMPARSAVLKCLQAHRREISKECRDVLRSKGR